jgi:DNA-binding NarL/FixJ family response regulator
MVENVRPPYRVLIVDDTPSVREALRLVFEGEEDMEIIGEAETGAEAILLATAMQPDFILLDYWLPDTTGTALLQPLHEGAPLALMIILTVESGTHFRREALARGASAYVLKTTPPPDLFRTLRQLMATPSS